jgi:hypothetical protein
MICNGETMRPGLPWSFSQGCSEAGDVQVGYREAAQPGLGLGALAHRALVADLAAGTGGGAGEGGDGGGVVVGFHLHQDVGGLGVEAVDPFRSGIEAADGGALDDGGVVGIGRQGGLGPNLMGVADHAEQGFRLLLAVDHPVGVEDLVAAMLRIGLGEHHQFHVGGIALHRLEVLHQVVDLVRGQGQAPVAVGLLQGLPAALEDVHGVERRRLDMMEQSLGARLVEQHAFRHAVVEAGQGGLDGFGRQAAALPAGQVPAHAPFDAGHLVQAAVGRDVAGLGGPGRDRAQAGDDEDQIGFRRVGFGMQQLAQEGQFGLVQIIPQLDEITVIRRQAGDAVGLQPGQQLVDAEIGEGGTALQMDDAKHGLARRGLGSRVF